ncbi:PAS domain-containing protein [Kordiimonas pumila]|uniref:PAS domain-containing protein n=1 Tax=Kordiimonas pumila TaxID=2161677 RepID=A0ABV7D3X0_9PROT|nr:PAS domain-containing protein [Kordiimonas pumila]
MKTEPKAFKDLIACWQNLPRSKGQAPLKSAFRPTALRHLVTNLFLVEKVGRTSLCIRLIGSDIEGVFGKGLRAGGVFDTERSEEWGYYGNLFETSTQQLCACRLQRTLNMENARTYDVDALCVPLADNEGTPRYILGVMLLQRNYDRGRRFMDGSAPKERILGLDYVDLGTGIPAMIPEVPSIYLKNLGYC